MRTQSSTSLTRLALSLPLLFLGVGATTLTSGCAVQEASESEVAESTEALSTTPLHCQGQKALPARTCNKVVCQDIEYVYQPVSNAIACTTSTGAAGHCDTGDQRGTCLQAAVTGRLTPKFYVLSVQYAPPGSASTATYGASSSVSTSASSTDSWSTDLSVTVSNNADFLGFSKAGISVTAGVNTSDSTKSTSEVKETSEIDLSINGQGDAVDHLQDRIFLLLRPQINVTVYGKDVSWAFGPPTPATTTLYVTPGWLLNPSTMNSNVRDTLRAAGITQDDYAQILSVDPYATATPSKVDTARYVLQARLPYEPLSAAGARPTTAVYSSSESTVLTSTKDSKVTYKTGVTFSGSAAFIGFANTELKVSDTLTWGNDNSTSSSTSSQLSMKAQISQPGVDYNGGIAVDVYLDTIFNTFLFVVEPKPLIYRGPPIGPIKLF